MTHSGETGMSCEGSAACMIKEDTTVRERGNVCYYVMKLAPYGELFKLIENTERFSERLSRTLCY